MERRPGVQRSFTGHQKINSFKKTVLTLK